MFNLIYVLNFYALEIETTLVLKDACTLKKTGYSNDDTLDYTMILQSTNFVHTLNLTN